MTFPLVLCSLIRIFAGELRNSPARMGGTLAKSKLSALGLHHPCKVCCRDGGMVDTRDLKSLGHNGCAGSSPARGTRRLPQQERPLGQRVWEHAVVYLVCPNRRCLSILLQR